MISCEEASLICNKAQYKEATTREKLKLWFHLTICKTCSKFSKQNAKLTTLCNKANLQTLSEKEKLQIKQRMEKRD
jgi:hypothetical protein